MLMNLLLNEFLSTYSGVKNEVGEDEFAST